MTVLFDLSTTPIDEIDLSNFDRGDGPVVVTPADVHLAPSSTHGVSLAPWDTKMDVPGSWVDGLRSLDQVIDVCNLLDADYLTIPGDLFDEGTPKPEIVFRLKTALRRLNRTKAIILNGNHDERSVHASHRSPIDAYLSDDSGINVIHTSSTAEVFSHDGVDFALLPWRRVAGKKVSQQIDLLEDVNKLGDAITSPISMFLSHCVVDSVPFVRGSEEEMSFRGAELPIPIDLIEKGPWQTAQLGHIHRRQQLASKTFYVGSTYKVSFNEVDEDKGVSVNTWHNGVCRTQFVKFNVRNLHKLTIGDGKGEIPTLTDSMLSGMKPGDIVRILSEDIERYDIVTAQKNLLQMGVIPDIRQLPVYHEQVATRHAGLALTTDPVEVLVAYGRKQETDADTVMDAVKLFREQVVQ